MVKPKANSLGDGLQAADFTAETDPREAWNRRVARHHRAVVVALLARGIRVDRAHDLAQAAWEKLWERQLAGGFPRLELPGLAIRQALFLAAEERRQACKRVALEGSTMQKQMLAVIAVCLGCAHAAARPISRNAAASAQEEIGRRFVEQLGRRDFTAAAAPFTDKMRAVFPPDKLAESWDTYLKKWGALQAVESIRAEPFDSGWAVLVTARFAKGVNTLEVSLDTDNRIRGYWYNAAPIVGRLFVERLANGDDGGADALSDEAVHDVAPPRELAKMWSKMENLFGPFQRIVSSKPGELGASMVIAFARSTVTFSVAIDSDGQMAGFRLVGAGHASAAGAHSAPEVQSEPQLDFDRQAAP